MQQEARSGGLLSKAGPLPRQMFLVGLLWSKYEFIFFAPQTGLGDNTGWDWYTGPGLDER